MRQSSGAGWRLLFLLSGVLAAPASAEEARWHVFHHEHVLGTSLELRFATPSADAAATAERAALAEIDRLAAILSGYDATSEFRRWQATQGTPQPVSPDLQSVLALFDAWRDRTGGALDAAAEVACRLWATAARQQRVPTAEELSAAVAAIRQPHWQIDPAAGTAAHLTAAPLILNSFAKSFIIDRACAAALAAGSLDAACVNIGGDLVVRGAAATAVDVTDPEAEAENDVPLTRLAVRDRAVATSGGYRRGVEIQGRWYSHLIDPRTGRPVDHVLGATVVAPRATDAGALATALCVLPAEEGLRLAASVPQAECLLVLRDGRHLTSPGWAALVTSSPASGAAGVHAAVGPSDGARPAAAAAAPGAAFELLVRLEVANVSGGRARRPFVAVWLEDKDGFPVRTLALWFHGPRWLPDLRSWYRADQMRAMAEATQITATVSSATRGPGKYSLKWDGRDNSGHPVPPGRYTLMIEAAREHGTHQLISSAVDTTGSEQHVTLPDNVELAAASFDFRPLRATR